MTEINENPASKSRQKTAPAAATVFEFPKFDIPKFDMPNFEMPGAFRELAEKSIAMAKDNYDKMKSVAEEATDVLEETYSTASKGCSGYGFKLIETARVNSNSAFDLFGEMLTAKSYAEVVELVTGYTRRQFDAVTAQTKDLVAEAQKVATDTAEPLKESFSNAFGKAA